MKTLLTALLALSTPALARGPLQFETRDPKAHAELIWTDGIMQIRRPSGSEAPKIGYAVFKARPSQSLDLYLSDRYAMAPMPQSWDMNYYAVPIDTLDRLDALAAWAHESTGRCGGIELVSGTSKLRAASSQFFAPIYGARLAMEEAKPWINAVSLPAMQQSITTLSALPSRYYKHPQGVTAHTTVRQLWEAVMVSGRWTITEEDQSLSAQKSIVARLPGLSKPDETIVIGAHLDSTTSRTGDSVVDPAPGADDDASGVAALTEILRVIESGQLSFDRSIELQAYAAEEVGLVGSKAIASRYAEAGRKIAGMMQIDMAAYSAPGASGIMHLLQDYNSRDLRRQAIDWIRNYIGPVYKLGFLPRGSASDHKAFYDQGYQTFFAFEDPEHDNPYIHTADDTMAQFDDGLLQTRITQLGLLFAMHQAGLQSLATPYQSLLPEQLPESLRQGLTVAVQKGKSQYYLAIGAPANTNSLEFCQIDSAGNPHCAQERSSLLNTASAGDRKIFYSGSTFDLAPGQNWRVLAYDASDNLVAFRQFTLKAP